MIRHQRLQPVSDHGRFWIEIGMLFFYKNVVQ